MKLLVKPETLYRKEMMYIGRRFPMKVISIMAVFQISQVVINVDSKFGRSFCDYMFETLKIFYRGKQYRPVRFLKKYKHVMYNLLINL